MDRREKIYDDSVDEHVAAYLYYVNSSGKVAMVGTETKFSIA